MPRLCGVCIHHSRDEIDRAILEGEADEMIARRFGMVSRQSVQRHGARHVPKALQTAFAAEQTKKGRTLLERVERHVDRLERMADEADSNGRAELLAVSRELTSALTLLGKATGEIQTGPQVQINVLTAVCQRLGVRDEVELRGLVDGGRELQRLIDRSLNEEEARDNAVELLRSVLLKHPGWESQVRERLSPWLEREHR